MIPNITQIPNELFDKELVKMKETELKIVLIVARKTLGWIANPITGMRKEEDWISRNQLIKATGKSQDAVRKGIATCIQNQWIEARDKNGILLNTGEKRMGVGRGSKIYYRLGITLLDTRSVLQKTTTSKDFSQKSYFRDTEGLKKYYELREKFGF